VGVKGNGSKRTQCPISREQFREQVQPVRVQIGSISVEVDPKEFSTGSLGWYLNGKTSVEVGGVKCPVQIGLSLTIIGSKELPQG
jgi:hypothetical protein